MDRASKITFQLSITLHILMFVRPKLEVLLFSVDLNARYFSSVDRKKLMKRSNLADQIYIFFILIVLLPGSKCMYDMKPIVMIPSGVCSLLNSIHGSICLPIFWVVQVVEIFVIFTILTLIFYVYYWTTVLRIQFLMLTNCASKLDEMPDEKHIKDLLSLVIENHHKIVRIFNTCWKVFYPAYLSSSFGIFIILTFLTLTIFSGFKEYVFVSTYLVIIGCLTVGFIVSHASQLAEDTNENFCLTLYNLKWYDWDRINMKTFYIFLTIANKPLCLNITSEIKTNHEYFKSILAAFYTLASFLKNFSPTK